MNDKDITEIKIHLAEIKVDLRHHIKRTEILENELKPIRKHVHVINGVGALLGITSVVVAIIIGAIKIIGSL